MITTNKPLICKRCGKKMGTVRIKWNFRVKLIVAGLALVFISEIVAELAVDLLFKSSGIGL